MAQNPAQEALRQRLGAGVFRLRLNDAIGAASLTAMFSLGAMATIIVIQRIFFLGVPVKHPVLALLGMPAWALWSMLGLILVPVVTGSVAYLLSPKGLLTAAVIADERLGLRARLSSVVALDAACARSAMTPALLADAQQHSKAIRAARDFPVRAPRSALFLPFGLCALMLAMVCLPQADVLGREQEFKEKEREKEEVVLAAKEIEKQLREALKRKPPRERTTAKNLPSKQLDDELSKLVKEMQEVQDREQAIAKLNKLMDKAKMLEMRITSMAEMMKQMERLKEMGEKADLPKGPAEKMAAAMAAGDFKKAAEEMEKLKEKLKDAGLSEEEKAALKRDLERLAKMTDDWKEMADQLQKAADNMGDEDALEAMQAAMEGLKELAQLVKELGLDKGAEGMAGEAQQVELTQEMIDQLKKMLKNAQKCPTCKKLYCLNCGKPRCACDNLEECDCAEGGGAGGLVGLPGLGQQGGGGQGGDGPGMGGYGQGEGGKAPEDEHDVKFQTSKVKGQMGEGRIISHMFVKGLPSVTDDEKKVEYQEAHDAAAKAASDEVSSGRIPRELRTYVRDYFTSTKPKAKTKTEPASK
ncbi:MAG: hypothetical protein ACYTGB_03800 [Planctomycetota bacterium]|jgi:tetratricopeptide (TPR) repeat protein